MLHCMGNLDLVELAASRSHLTTNNNEVARALDYLKDHNRIVEEPVAPPAAVNEVATSTPTSPSPGPTASSETSGAAPSTLRRVRGTT